MNFFTFSVILAVFSCIAVAQSSYDDDKNKYPYGDYPQYGCPPTSYPGKPPAPAPAPIAIGKVLKCPDLTSCKKIKLGKPVFQNIGPSGSVCVYTKDLTSSCNLSFSGSFCFLQGIFFGPQDVVSDKDGNTVVKGC